MLSGELPPELTALTSLETLYLGGNTISGCVPAGLRNIPTGDVAVLGLPFCTTLTEAQAADKEALVALYHATDGPNWTNNTNWLTDKPVNTWFGVTTNDNRKQVRFLTLGDNNLPGDNPLRTRAISPA